MDVRYKVWKSMELDMEQKKQVPQKGAAKKWSERLKQLREQPPSEELMNILNRNEKPRKITRPKTSAEDLDI